MNFKQIDTAEGGKKPKAVSNEAVRDYKLIVFFSGEKQTWYGSEEGFYASHPRGKVLKKTKLKKK